MFLLGHRLNETQVDHSSARFLSSASSKQGRIAVVHLKLCGDDLHRDLVVVLFEDLFSLNVSQLAWPHSPLSKFICRRSIKRRVFRHLEDSWEVIGENTLAFNGHVTVFLLRTGIEALLEVVYP